MLSPPRRRMVEAPSIESVHIPAPVGGLNTISAAGAMPPTDCVQLYNMTAAEYGLRTRLGNREWCTGLTGAADNYVRTVLPFMGSALAGTANKVFATTSTGIWDVTASLVIPSAWQAAHAYVIGDRVLNDGGKIYICDTTGTSAGATGPTGTGANIVDNTARWDYVSTPLAITFGTQTGDAGYGICHAFTTTAGHFLLYCDEVNGYFVYSEGGAWAKIAMGGGGTQVSGVDPANFCFVTVWKSRVWFVEKSTAKAWYLAAGAVYGAATQLDFGKAAQFRQGGYLVGLWSWTGDGGAGIDDQLVGVSSGGDVFVYQGSDPASADTFQHVGTYGVGSIPSGRDIATSRGGDLLILTAGGPFPMSKLVVGGEGQGTYQTEKIPNLFNSLMLSKASLRGWAMRIHPEDNTLMVAVPTTTGTATEQLVMSLGRQSWGRYRDLPIHSMAVWDRKLYFGTVDGRVCINDGYLDGVTLADPNSFTPVQWSVLGAFNGLGNGRNKQVVGIRPEILCDGGAPNFETAARYDYDFTELANVTQSQVGEDSWDVGLWDVAVWAGDFAPTSELRGAVGMGKKVSIAVRGTATARTVLVGYDVLFRQGGLL